MDIQQRIDELMKQNNIDTYITLLRKIFKCSVRDESKTDVQWATNQKSNFTNMLKGKRPFTVEMILGLEHVLHTSMDSIINNLPYAVSFRRGRRLRQRLRRVSDSRHQRFPKTTGGDQQIS